jgi:VWFA-related protein
MQGATDIRTGVRNLLALGFACILLSCLGLALSKQPEDASPPARSESSDSNADRSPTKILVNSDLVVIPVTVTDSKGRVVSGLQKEHFTLYEDKVKQAITQFGSEDAPASIGLVFDTSDSMGPKLPKAREAVAALLKNANPEDEFFLVEFNHHPRLTVRMTKQSEEIQNQVEMVQTNGATALLDAILLALNEMRNAHYTRKAIIIISDGEDNSSQCSVGVLKQAVGQADVLIYAIGIVDSGSSYQMSPSDKLTGSALLNEIAKQTGGRLFEVNKLKQLPGIASKIGAWLRNQYVLAYAPATLEKNGRYHHIQVKLMTPAGFPRLHACWRLGYYAPME